VTVVSLLAVGAAADEGATKGEWLELRSEHLVLYTDGDEVLGRSILQTLEVLRATVSELTFGGSAEPQLPTTLLVFSGEESYAPYRLHGRDGAFFSAGYENLLILNAGARLRSPITIAAHEYLHAFLAEVGLDLPLWLNEGLAEYYSTTRRVGPRVVIGISPTEHRATLRGEAFLPIDEVFALEPGSSEYLDHRRAARFYAQSWLMVHYLMSDERYRGLSQLASLASEGSTGEEAIAEALELSPERFESELRAYLGRSRLPGFSLESPLGRRALHVESRALEDGEVAAVLGLVSIEQARWARSPDRLAEARSLLESAVADRPEDGDMLAVLAYLEDVRGNGDRAATLFERAVYLDARQARTYALYLQFLVARRDRGEDSVSAEQLGLLLNRALEMEPWHRTLRSIEADLR
jgi:hypothetical protein